MTPCDCGTCTECITREMGWTFDPAKMVGQAVEVRHQVKRADEERKMGRTNRHRAARKARREGR